MASRLFGARGATSLGAHHQHGSTIFHISHGGGLALATLIEVVSASPNVMSSVLVGRCGWLASAAADAADDKYGRATTEGDARRSGDGCTEDDKHVLERLTLEERGRGGGGGLPRSSKTGGR
ncbi:hypothetical protein AB1Y20_017271 [Prymnesium parvum]|uniref:Uncharacterized protein n=1 Tax=Prymnesium parvum TaxID=97485 RepID=A0AB34JNH0_PRYPA